MTLALELYQGDELVSRNDYPLICAEKQWYAAAGKVLASDATMGGYLMDLGFRSEYPESIDWSKLDTSIPVAVRWWQNGIEEFVERGGRVLMMEPDFVPGVGLKMVQTSGDFVDIFEAELLDGMDPMDMHWWNNNIDKESATGMDTPRVCRTSYQFADVPGVTKLAQHIQPHGYIRSGRTIATYTSWPVFEVQMGKGRLIASSLLLTNDPLAKRFTTNLVKYLMR